MKVPASIQSVISITTTMPLRRLLATLSALAVSACAHPALAPSPSASISEQQLRADLYALADDSTMGRETGSEGDYKAGAWVAARFQRLGLRPAGENGTWYQTVPFWLVRPDPASHLTVGGTSLGMPGDLLPFFPRMPSVTLRDAIAIHGGDVTDSTTWISGDQARGKLVILDAPPGATRFPVSPARWRSAAALAIAVLDVTPAERVARAREGTPAPDSTPVPSMLPIFWISRHAAATLLGNDPRGLRPGSESPARVNGMVGMTRTPVRWPARNVVAILPGSDPVLRNEYVSVSAHHDHVGFDHAPVDHDSLRAFNRIIRPMGADSPPREPTADEWRSIHHILDSLRRIRPARLDSIRNGADDDGSGTVALLAIAERLARGDERPRRSILFVSHTAEEAGLLGSRWYADHPTVPRDSIVAEVDMDMVGRGTSTDMPRDGTGAGGPTYLEVVGARRLSRQFGDMLDAANARQPLPFQFNLTYDAPGHPLQYYCRADHFSYARWGIPAMSIARGEHLDYHQVTDEAEYIDYPALARVAMLVHDLVLDVANADSRPALDAPKPDPDARCVQ